MEGQKEKKWTLYPRQFKLQVAEEIVLRKKGPSEAARDYNIPRNIIYNWVKQFRDVIYEKKENEMLPSLTMSNTKENPSKADLQKQLQVLEGENQMLRKKLTESILQTEALNTLVELAEEHYGISLRKNSGAKQSKG